MTTVNEVTTQIKPRKNWRRMVSIRSPCKDASATLRTQWFKQRNFLNSTNTGLCYHLCHEWGIITATAKSWQYRAEKRDISRKV